MSRPSERAVNRPAFSHVSQARHFWEECEGVHRVFDEVHRRSTSGLQYSTLRVESKGFNRLGPERSTKSISSRIIRGGTDARMVFTVHPMDHRGKRTKSSSTSRYSSAARRSPHNILTGINAHHDTGKVSLTSSRRHGRQYGIIGTHHVL